LRQFMIRPNLQGAWHQARDSAEAALLTKPDANGRLALFPWANDAAFRQISGVLSHNVQRKKELGGYQASTEKLDASISRLSSSDLACFSTFNLSVEAADNHQCTKKTNGVRLRDLATSFEFENLQFVHISRRGIFVCSSCGLPGEHNSNGVCAPPIDSNAVAANGGACGGLSVSTTDGLSNRYPDIRPCAGGCGNYVHPGCAKSIKLPPLHKSKLVLHTGDGAHPEGDAHLELPSASSSTIEHANGLSLFQVGFSCDLCLQHLRRCFICGSTQPCPQIFPGALSSFETLPNTSGSRSVTSVSDVSPTDHDNTQRSAEPIHNAIANTAVCQNDIVKQGSAQQDQMIRCSVKSCSRWYHPSCLRKPPFSTVVRDRRAGSFWCPAHACLACAVETPGTLPRPTPTFIRCLLCPAAYHPGDWCLPAGSKQVRFFMHYCFFPPTQIPDKFMCEDCSGGRFPRFGEIVWSRLPPNLNTYQPHVAKSDVSKVDIDSSDDEAATLRNEYASLTAGMYWWPGEIVHPRHLSESNIAVETQPGSFAYKAVDKISQQVSNPTEHPLGLFPVRLFGLTTHSKGDDLIPIVVWSTRARLFPYEEGDDKRSADSSMNSTGDEEDELMGNHEQRCNSYQDDGEDEDPLLQLSKVGDKDQTNPDKDETGLQHSPFPNLRPRPARVQSKKSVRRKFSQNASIDPTLLAQRKLVYSSAVKQAADGWSKRREKFNQLLGRTRRPDYYKPIKVNWPLGSVRVYRLTDPSEAPRCECQPNSDTEPCGPSSNCINRELHYECLPSVCPNGNACQNQRFTKRLYPAQRPFWTGEERGWGLKTLVPIRSGDFVNEYIGDLIDEEEANRRLRFAHENNVTNYYMMKLDSQRIIDAGPKGNLSRFMNHSCNPNLNTQKWTVNGDNRIGLFAVRDIAAGEELTFDYNFVALGQERLNCRCGAPNCTGFLGASSSSISQSISNGCHTSHKGAEDLRLQKPAHGTGVKCASSAETAPDDKAVHKGHREYHCFSAVEHRSCLNEESGPTKVVPMEFRHKDLTANSPDPSVVNEDSSDAVKRRCTLKTVGVKHSDALGSEMAHVDPRGKDMIIFCSKSDCDKAYHLGCLDIDSPPSG
uniref:Histone-lysine N-methyltransferase n=1 Tax=Echinostoma caproni TaxID=27848 RepID=A0A183AMX3_9TREM